MVRVLVVIFVCLSTFSAVCQTASQYQVGTITAVKPHQAENAAGSDAGSYDVSLKVGGTVYVVAYKPPLGMNTVQYAAGRELLVLVGEKTIMYNDILGRSFEVPIVSRKPAADARQSR
jgi:formylmethanofuran dehydrogenase subunit A